MSPSSRSRLLCLGIPDADAWLSGQITAHDATNRDLLAPTYIFATASPSRWQLIVCTCSHKVIQLVPDSDKVCMDLECGLMCCLGPRDDLDAPRVAKTWPKTIMLLIEFRWCQETKNMFAIALAEK